MSAIHIVLKIKGQLNKGSLQFCRVTYSQTCGDRFLIEIDLIVRSLFADRERAIDPRPRSRSRSRSKGCDQF